MIMSPQSTQSRYHPHPHPAMDAGTPSSIRGQRILAAIVITDAVGFSARMSTDEESTLALIERDSQLIREHCAQFEGQVLKSTGDGLLMYFVSAVQAVACALQVQRSLATLNSDLPAEEVLLHRIGIHLGDVFLSESDVMGNGVNIAARLETEAYPGGVCISKMVYDVVKSRLQLAATSVGPLQLKNIREEVHAYQLDPLATEPTETTKSVVTMVQTHLQVGDTIDRRYRIRRVLGQGGFGRSYLVEDNQRFGEMCVVKEFAPANKAEYAVKKGLALFKREAKTLYQINHPQVPKFLACFSYQQRLFIVQEYIDGVTYSQFLRQRQNQSQPFTEVEVVQWLCQMLAVLDYLHNLGIVHRDISPDNIIVSRDRNLPVLIDFGLVNDVLSQLDSEISDTPGNAFPKCSIVGKLGYSPPEQIQLGDCSPCSDLYALAVTAVVLLTGKSPRHLVHPTTMEWTWVSMLNLQPTLVQVLQKMLLRKPHERYQSAQEVLSQLQSLPGALPLQTPWQSPSSSMPTTHLDSTRLFDLAEVPVTPVHPSSPTAAEDNAAHYPEFLEQCRKELARSIGPMAPMLLEDALEQFPSITPQGLVETLASQISSAEGATQFAQRITLPRPVSTSTPSGTRSHVRPITLSGEDLSVVPVVDAAFVERCRQELARCIGPMAAMVLADVMADYPQLSPQDLVARLAAEIPNDQRAASFLKAMT